MLAPDGKPLSDAKVYIVFHAHDQAPPPKVRAATSADGGFSFAMDRSEFERLRASQLWNDISDDVDYKNDCRLVAVADGYGPVWQPAFAFDASGDSAQVDPESPSNGFRGVEREAEAGIDSGPRRSACRSHRGRGGKTYRRGQGRRDIYCAAEGRGSHRLARDGSPKGR